MSIIYILADPTAPLSLPLSMTTRRWANHSFPSAFFFSIVHETKSNLCTKLYSADWYHRYTKRRLLLILEKSLRMLALKFLLDGFRTIKPQLFCCPENDELDWMNPNIWKWAKNIRWLTNEHECCWLNLYLFFSYSSFSSACSAKSIRFSIFLTAIPVAFRPTQEESNTASLPIRNPISLNP